MEKKRVIGRHGPLALFGSPVSLRFGGFQRLKSPRSVPSRLGLGTGEMRLIADE
jgi:hypothetical protein